MKLTHVLSKELLSRMTKQLSISNLQLRKTGLVDDAILSATKEGIFEFVSEMVKVDPVATIGVQKRCRNMQHFFGCCPKSSSQNLWPYLWF